MASKHEQGKVISSIRRLLIIERSFVSMSIMQFILAVIGHSANIAQLITSIQGTISMLLLIILLLFGGAIEIWVRSHKSEANKSEIGSSSTKSWIKLKRQKEEYEKLFKLALFALVTVIIATVTLGLQTLQVLPSIEKIVNDSIDRTIPLPPLPTISDSKHLWLDFENNSLGEVSAQGINPNEQIQLTIDQNDPFNQLLMVSSGDEDKQTSIDVQLPDEINLLKGRLYIWSMAVRYISIPFPPSSSEYLPIYEIVKDGDWHQWVTVWLNGMSYQYLDGNLIAQWEDDRHFIKDLSIKLPPGSIVLIDNIIVWSTERSIDLQYLH